MSYEANHQWPKSNPYVLHADEVNNDITPMGSIIPWLKTLTNTPTLPSNWVECDGTVISDVSSLMNGFTLPLLNGSTEDTKCFVRGGDVVDGSVEGLSTADCTHSHGTDNGFVRSPVSGTPCLRDITVDEEILEIDIVPPYYEVVWIMRIK